MAINIRGMPCAFRHLFQVFQGSSRFLGRCQQCSWFCSRALTVPHEEQRDDISPRSIPVTKDGFRKSVKKKPQPMEDPRLLRVAVIGTPNTGKSTLINNLVKWKVCSVSKKVHTTRKSARAVMVNENVQVVFLDTPGLVTADESAKHQLEQCFAADPEKALVGADLIAIMHDVSNRWTRGQLDPKVLRLLHLYPYKDSILILNKIDLIKSKRILLELTRFLTEGLVGGHQSFVEKKRPFMPSKKTLFLRAEEKERELKNQFETKEPEEEPHEEISNTLTEKQVQKLVEGKKGWHRFNDVFMLSALKENGVDELRNYLVNSARPAPWMFSSSVVTDQNPLDIALQIVKEKLLELLPDEIPYIVQPKIEYWDVSEDGRVRTVIQLLCPRSGLTKILIGPKGRTVQHVAKEAEQDLRNIFRQEVYLRLVIVAPEMK